MLISIREIRRLARWSSTRVQPMFVRREITMPYKPFKPCAHPGCARLVPPTEMYCERHKALHPKPRYDCKYNHERASAHARGYTKQWQSARRGYLAANPLCVECLKEGRYERATVVDHIIPHRGNMDRFWDRDNWQSLCKRHHDVKTKTIDAEYIRAHPWEGGGRE